LSLAKEEWAESVHGIDVKQIKSAFERIKAAGEQFPPSLPKFLSYCKNNTDWAHKGAAYKRFRKALPKPPADKNKARSAFADMRNALAGELVHD